MTVIIAVTGGNYTHTLDAWVSSQDIAGNYSVVSYVYNIHRNSSAANGAYASARNFSVNINGQVDTESKAFDFRSYADLTAASGAFVIYHNADGTGSISASISGPGSYVSAGMPITSGSGSMALPTIARASNATFSPSPAEIGTLVTINTNRASAGFTHDISYTFGSQIDIPIASGVGASTTWTPPLSLLNEIPNSISGVAAIKTVTKNGATVIGTTTANLTLQAGAAIVPDFTTVTHSEATTVPPVATLIGAYVKGISALNVAITGAIGSYGSTITTYKIEVAGQTINAASGTTAPIQQNGTLTLRGTVTDSRGRTVVKDVSISVLNYNPPTIVSATIQRSTNTGTPDANGTYLKLDLQAVTQSLVVGTQKNNLTWRIKTRERGDDTPWSTITPDAEATVAATGFADDEIVGTYPVANSYDVRIEVSDILGTTTAIEGVLPTGGVQIHYSRTEDGIGVGKFHEQGSIDALGQIYQRDGKRVLDEDDLLDVSDEIDAASIHYGTVDPYYTDGLVTVTVDGVIHTGVRFIGDPPYGGTTVATAVIDGELVVLGARRDQADMSRQYALPGPATSEWYSVDGQFGEARFTKSSAGWVSLSGLIYTPTLATTAGTLLATLPVGFRPLRDMWFVGFSGSTGGTFKIAAATGEITVVVPSTSNTLMSLDGVGFTANTGLSWTYPTVTAPWVARAGQEPRYAVDPAGRVILEGWVQGGAVGQVAFNLPVGIRPVEGHDIHNGVNNNGGMFSHYVYNDGKVIPQSGAVAGGVCVNASWYPGTDGWRRITLSNSSNYLNGFRTVGIRKLPDNTVMMKGLIGISAGLTKLFGLPPSLHPRERKIFSPRAVDATGRLDVYSNANNPQEVLAVFIAGQGGWVSLSSLQWPTERTG